MGMSVSSTMGFENKEMIRDTAKNSTQGNTNAAENAKGNTAQNTVTYTTGRELSSQEYILLASTQITLNQSLKETLKYLRKHANDRKKEYAFGDLWKVFNTENEDSEQNPYKGELFNFKIDSNKKNIFAA